MKYSRNILVLVIVLRKTIKHSIIHSDEKCLLAIKSQAGQIAIFLKSQLPEILRICRITKVISAMTIDEGLKTKSNNLIYFLINKI